MPIKIYGASDDLIEIEGDIEEEFNPPEYDEPSLLAFSDGTVLQVTYDKGGFWRIAPLVKGTAKFSKIEATHEDSDYSDKVTLGGEIKWVVCGSSWAKRSKR